MEGFAGRGHRFTKVPQAWVPSTEEVPPGKTSANLAALLEGQRKLWSDLWIAGGESIGSRGFEWPADLACPKLLEFSLDQVRGAANSFPRGIAGASDGFNVPEHQILKYSKRF